DGIRGFHVTGVQTCALPISGISFCAELLNLTRAQVAAVATFYTVYKRAPTGDWLISVCTNTMCGVLGGDAVYQTLQEELGVGHAIGRASCRERRATRGARAG